MDNIKETIEALIFASGEPVSKKDIIERIPSLTTRELNKIVEELKVKYGGDSGIVLASFNDKLQFTSNPRYGDTLVEVLTPIREKALSQSLLEVLSIIAYKQPVTRQEIEDIKGGKDPDYALSVLMKVNLIEVKGRKDAVGRPFLFGTTDEFLRKSSWKTSDTCPITTKSLTESRFWTKTSATPLATGCILKRNSTSISPTLSKLAAQCRSFRQKTSLLTRHKSSPKTTTISTIWTRTSTTFPTF